MEFTALSALLRILASRCRACTDRSPLSDRAGALLPLPTMASAVWSAMPMAMAEARRNLLSVGSVTSGCGVVKIDFSLPNRKLVIGAVVLMARAVRKSVSVLPACTDEMLLWSSIRLMPLTERLCAPDRSASKTARVLLSNSVRAMAGPPTAPSPMEAKVTSLVSDCWVRAVTVTSLPTDSRAPSSTWARVSTSLCAMPKAKPAVVAWLPLPSWELVELASRCSVSSLSACTLRSCAAVRCAPLATPTSVVPLTRP